MKATGTVRLQRFSLWKTHSPQRRTDRGAAFLESMADYFYTMEIRLTPDQQRGVTLVQDIARPPA